MAAERVDRAHLGRDDLDEKQRHPNVVPGKRARGAREIAASKWAEIADRCWLCGLAIGRFRKIAHLDQRRSNNDPDNLAYFCPTATACSMSAS